jgi:hypothetical protein
MATVIDSLIVSLGLDPKGFTKGQKEAVEALRKTDAESTKSAKHMQENGKKSAETFTKLRNEVLTLAGSFVALSAIRSFVSDITAGDAAVGRLSKNVDMSTEDVTAWQGAVQRAGGTAEGMSRTLQGITQGFQEWQLTGVSPAMEAMSQFGVHILDAQGKMRPMNDILLESADILSEISKRQGGAAAQKRGSMMGLDEGTVNLLMQGRASVESLLAKQRQLNVVSESDARAAQRRENAWKNLMDTFTGIGRVLLNEILPVVTKLATEFMKWVANPENIQILKDSIKDLAQWLKTIDWTKVKEGLGGVLDAAEALAKAISSIVEGFVAISKFTGEGAGFIANLTSGPNMAAIENNAQLENIRKQYALRHAGKGAQAGGASSTSVVTNVGTVNVTAPNARDVTGATSEGIAAAHRKQVNRALNAAQLNAG